MSAASGTLVALARDCPATAVPYGTLFTLPAGEHVRIVQTLGGSITVQTEFGALFRVDGADADALGVEDPGRNRDVATSRAFTMDDVIAALHDVYDPEIPVSVVDLGLIYRCEEQIRDDGTRLISIDMSMTAPGCGMGDVLRADAERVVRMVPGVDAVEVTLVWDPPWSISRMSDAVRLQLGLL
jgi:probable FeS assembly SUF system protein SufT